MFMLGWSLIVACATLAGSWSGNLECDHGDDSYVKNEEIEIEFDLEGGPDGYEGTGSSKGSFDVDDTGGNTYTFTVEIEFDLEVDELDGSGEQELDQSAEITDCEADVSPEIQGYDATSEVCDGAEDPSGDGEWTWDGRNTISTEGDDCEGELER